MSDATDLSSEIEILRGQYTSKNKMQEKDTAYNDLLSKYEQALQRISDLESQLSATKSNKMPSKEDVDTMSSMLDLINKLDDSTIEKLNKFGSNK